MYVLLSGGNRFPLTTECECAIGAQRSRAGVKLGGEANP
jgi:hypothetical protein